MSNEKIEEIELKIKEINKLKESIKDIEETIYIPLKMQKNLLNYEIEIYELQKKADNFLYEYELKIKEINKLKSNINYLKTTINSKEKKLDDFFSEYNGCDCDKCKKNIKCYKKEVEAYYKAIYAMLGLPLPEASKKWK